LLRQRRRKECRFALWQLYVTLNELVVILVLTHSGMARMTMVIQAIFT